MTFGLRGPRIKIDRAYLHLADLERTEREFFEATRPHIVIEDNPQGSGKLAKVRIDSPVPERLHIIAGELLYQLRSSLDQIAVAFGRKSVAKPNVKKIYFPTGDSLPGFQAAASKGLVGVDADLVAQITNLKPYDGGDDVLRAVFRMANVDKHLELIPAAAHGHISGISHFTVHGMFILDGALQPLHDGIVIADLGTRGSISPNHPNAHISVTGQILLGNTSIYDGRPLTPFLKELADKTREVFKLLRSHLAKTGRL